MGARQGSGSGSTSRSSLQVSTSSPSQAGGGPARQEVRPRATAQQAATLRTPHPAPHLLLTGNPAKGLHQACAWHRQDHALQRQVCYCLELQPRAPGLACRAPQAAPLRGRNPGPGPLPHSFIPGPPAAGTQPAAAQLPRLVPGLEATQLSTRCQCLAATSGETCAAPAAGLPPPSAPRHNAPGHPL